MQFPRPRRANPSKRKTSQARGTPTSCLVLAQGPFGSLLKGNLKYSISLPSKMVSRMPLPPNHRALQALRPHSVRNQATAVCPFIYFLSGCDFAYVQCTIPEVSFCFLFFLAPAQDVAGRFAFPSANGERRIRAGGWNCLSGLGPPPAHKSSFLHYLGAGPGLRWQGTRRPWEDRGAATDPGAPLLQLGQGATVPLATSP